MERSLFVFIRPLHPDEALNVDHIAGLQIAHYSYRNALIGSTRDARCAGMKPAASATIVSDTAALVNTIGSHPFISKSSDCASPPRATAAPTPSTPPTIVIRPPCPNPSPPP